MMGEEPEPLAPMEPSASTPPRVLESLLSCSEDVFATMRIMPSGVCLEFVSPSADAQPAKEKLERFAGQAQRDGSPLKTTMSFRVQHVEEDGGLSWRRVQAVGNLVGNVFSCVLRSIPDPFADHHGSMVSGWAAPATPQAAAAAATATASSGGGAERKRAKTAQAGTTAAGGSGAEAAGGHLHHSSAGFSSPSAGATRIAGGGDPFSSPQPLGGFHQLESSFQQQPQQQGAAAAAAEAHGHADFGMTVHPDDLQPAAAIAAMFAAKFPPPVQHGGQPPQQHPW